ncbi:MAG: hypothetical protein KIS92_19215 [Planctomycetota bacterium]|nr:hypothetical protein [Planctomycetota bacterium]
MGLGRACLAGILLLSAAGRAAEGDHPPAETVSLEASEDGTPLPLPMVDGEAKLGNWVAFRADKTKGSPEAFAWRQTEGVPLIFTEAEATAPVVWRLLERPGPYRLEVRARNAKGWSAWVPLAFEAPEGEPALPREQALAPAGAGESFADGTFLPGEGWKQVAGPPVRLSFDAMNRATVFRLVQPGRYIFEILRADNRPERRAFVVPPGKDDLVGDRRPEARLTLPQDAFLGTRVELDGSLSSDRDGDPLTAKWTSADKVRGVTITPLGGMKAEFTADREGVYRVRLVVNDGKLDSRPAETFVRVLKPAEAPVALADDVPPDTDPLSRRITLRCYDSNLDRAVQRFPPDCNLALRVNHDFCPPEDFQKRWIDVGGEYMPASLMLDWIARQTGASYRRDGTDGVWLLKPTQWAAEEKLKNEVVAADALFKEKDAADLIPLLRQPFRGLLAERQDAQLALQPDSAKVIAFLPEKACLRLKEMIAFLRAPKGLTDLQMALPPAAELLLRRKLAETAVEAAWKARRLDWLLRDLAEKTGVPVGFDARQFGGSAKLPKLTLAFEGAPLREVVREIVHAAGFDGCQAQNGAGLWFYKGGEPYPSGELLWDLVYVRAYPLDAVLGKLPLLSGEVIEHQVRRRVYPDSWKDPAVCCFYHAITGKLLVVHGEAAHARILSFLNDLAERGEDAFGPAESAEPPREGEKE